MDASSAAWSGPVFSRADGQDSGFNFKVFIVHGTENNVRKLKEERHHGW